MYSIIIVKGHGQLVNRGINEYQQIIREAGR